MDKNKLWNFVRNQAEPEYAMEYIQVPLKVDEINAYLFSDTDKIKLKVISP